MARQVHTVRNGTGKYPTSAQLVPFALLAADDTNYEQCDFTGRETIIAYNSSTDTAYDVTIESVASNRTGRSGNLVVEVPFGEIVHIGPLGLDGFKQSDGKLYFQGEDAAILFGVVRLPAL